MRSHCNYKIIVLFFSLFNLTEGENVLLTEIENYKPETFRSTQITFCNRFCVIRLDGDVCLLNIMGELRVGSTSLHSAWKSDWAVHVTLAFIVKALACRWIACPTLVKAISFFGIEASLCKRLGNKSGYFVSVFAWIFA